MTISFQFVFIWFWWRAFVRPARRIKNRKDCCKLSNNENVLAQLQLAQVNVFRKPWISICSFVCQGMTLARVSQSSNSAFCLTDLLIYKKITLILYCVHTLSRSLHRRSEVLFLSWHFVHLSQLKPNLSTNCYAIYE